MKISVSISDDDLAALDAFVISAGLPSRSAGVQRAISLLRHPHLEDDYVAAFAEWQASGDAALWDVTAGDGV
jgi:hypothetical protein